SFRQLILNLIGGIAFLAASMILASQCGLLELDALLLSDTADKYILLPVALLCLAGIVKSAQMPFHTWLLGAMVAPTPTSALLHSSTMVKAGVFILLKLSPLLQDNLVGYMVMTVGGLTFLLASMAAISQTNAKRVLAYSTIANLGLIVACAGVGTPEAAWAGVMLTVFHAITKSLLFLCVGTAEHHIGSRDIEDMDGLFDRMPRLARIMLVGIAAMFLAPLGMLISKWAAMTSFVDSEYIVLIACIVFGSAVTSFYWTKWMGKLAVVATGKDNVERTVHIQENVVLGTLVVLTVAVCALFPLMSEHMIVPWLESAFIYVPDTLAVALSGSNMLILLVMLLALILIFVPFFGRGTKRRIVPNYLSGEGLSNNTYNGSMGATVEVGLRNWYMTDWFGEDRIRRIGEILTALTIVVIIVLVAGGVSL
ncbi:MAG: proton-conducting transporter membrane subunit, partial [Candidatus Methanomethylophilaceae archaeon]